MGHNACLSPPLTLRVVEKTFLCATPMARRVHQAPHLNCHLRHNYIPNSAAMYVHTAYTERLHLNRDHELTSDIIAEEKLEELLARGSSRRIRAVAQDALWRNTYSKAFEYPAQKEELIEPATYSAPPLRMRMDGAAFFCGNMQPPPTLQQSILAPSASMPSKVVQSWPQLMRPCQRGLRIRNPRGIPSSSATIGVIGTGPKASLYRVDL